MDEVEKVKYAKPRYPTGPSSDTGGVKAFPIEGPMRNERYRLMGMTDEERAWRKQWLKDQILAADEPRPVPGYYQERLNPIRRFYRWPLETLFKPLIPFLGYDTAVTLRWWTGKIGLGLAAIYMTYYYFKYNTRDWTTRSGWRVRVSKPAVYPGDPRYPLVEVKKPSEYCSDGFEKSPI